MSIHPPSHASNQIKFPLGLIWALEYCKTINYLMDAYLPSGECHGGRQSHGKKYEPQL